MTTPTATDRFVREQARVDRMAEAYRKSAIRLEAERIAEQAAEYRFDERMEAILALKQRDPIAYARLPSEIKIAASIYLAAKNAVEAHEQREQERQEEVSR